MPLLIRNRWIRKTMNIYFSDYFDVSEDIIDEYGAFNISLITDLPLFIDPFLLFNSNKPEYQILHDDMIRYLRFLRTKSEQGGITPALIKAWYCFAEVKQNWLGFCESGNTGRGLGRTFARALDANMVHLFSNFGNEKVTQSSHLEKLCLIRSGVGRDMISDFTTNLTKDFLLTYTEKFARQSISESFIQSFCVNRAYFSYETERWMPKTYDLPVCNGDFIILTPRDILTKDDTWINHSDMYERFRDIPDAVDNDQLRAEINNYFYSIIPKEREPTKDDYDRAISSTLKRFPQIIDYYIRMKEQTGEQAVANSNLKVIESELLYIKQFGNLAHLLNKETPFYELTENTIKETREKIMFFKDVVENKGGHRIFYGSDGQPIRREKDIHIMFRLVWHGTPSDISREVNDGRGPADFKISRGSQDKTLIEFKLACNTQLKRNLYKQLDIYKKASDAEAGFKVIIYFSESELVRVEGILRELDMENDENVILVDARSDNKPSASKA